MDVETTSGADGGGEEFKTVVGRRSRKRNVAQMEVEEVAEEANTSPASDAHFVAPQLPPLSKERLVVSN